MSRERRTIPRRGHAGPAGGGAKMPGRRGYYYIIFYDIVHYRIRSYFKIQDKMSGIQTKWFADSWHGERDSIRHHLLEVTFETATVPESRQTTKTRYRKARRCFSAGLLRAPFWVSRRLRSRATRGGRRGRDILT